MSVSAEPVDLMGAVGPRSFRPLERHTRCVYGLSGSWRDLTVVVPASFWEWVNITACKLSRTRSRCLPEPPPAWLYSQYTTFAYQRIDADAPCFSPNRAFESGVFLQFIVEHLATGLPARTAFVQADWFDAPRRWHGLPTTPVKLWQPECMRSDWEDWMPLGKKYHVWPPYQVTRAARWYGEHKPLARYPKATHLLIEACWRELLGLFGHQPESLEPLNVTFYPALNFVVSRRRIEQYPLSTWVGAHARLVTKGVCLPGRLNARRVPGYSDDAGVRWLEDHADYGKLTVAMGMEAVAQVIFGNQLPTGWPGLTPTMRQDSCTL